MVDIAKAIEPRSDQQNYDDYIAGPRTVTVEAVDQDKEGRASIHLIEYPGRPFKPSKTNLRLIAQAWGTEAVQWNGRRMTLAGDPTVRFGGQQVGGIRVIALSHIEKAFTANLDHHSWQARPLEGGRASPRNSPHRSPRSPPWTTTAPTSRSA